MYTFQDMNGCNVTLAFKRDSFSKRPKHVFVITQYKGKWLLTKHKSRGLEFPGGKVEKGESLEGAAKREVLEETGAILKDLIYIGEYEVLDNGDRFVKAIFYGEVVSFSSRNHYYETEGPVLIGENILDERYGGQYSFIMKDLVVEKSLEYIEQMKKR